MRQRMAALTGLGGAALLGFLLLWAGLAAAPVSAMEKMAEKVREAKSCKYTEIVCFSMDSPVPGEPRINKEVTVQQYWIAPGSSRSERIQTSPREWHGPGPESTSFTFMGKPGITFNHRKKTFRRTPASRDPEYGSLEHVRNLSRYFGEADRELGTKEIGGKKARGFHIDMKKMDPDCPDGTEEIWIDTESDLPVLIRQEWREQLDHSLSILCKDFQWNVELDPKLFDPAPPEGYTEATPEKPLALEERVRRITEAFRIYAEASGGRYPEEFVFAWDPVEDLCKMLGVDNYPVKPKNDNERKAHKAWNGFDEVEHVRHGEADYAYYGKTVGPKDKHKVLLRWKLDDGKYQVIFGDLRSETVTAERLRGLEGT